MDNKKELEELRARIDGCDARIIKLLEERLEIVHKIAGYKIKTGTEIFDGERENEILNKTSSRVENPALTPYITEIFKGIISSSKAYQKKIYYEM